jgi:hypothetical protein
MLEAYHAIALSGKGRKRTERTASRDPLASRAGPDSLRVWYDPWIRMRHPTWTRNGTQPFIGPDPRCHPVPIIVVFLITVLEFPPQKPHWSLPVYPKCTGALSIWLSRSFRRQRRSETVPNAGDNHAVSIRHSATRAAWGDQPRQDQPLCRTRAPARCVARSGWSFKGGAT